MKKFNPVSRPVALVLLATPFLILLLVAAAVYQSALSTKVITSSKPGKFAISIDGENTLQPGTERTLRWGVMNAKEEIIPPSLMDRVFKPQEKIELLVQLDEKNVKSFTVVDRTPNTGKKTFTIPLSVNEYIEKGAKKAFFVISAVGPGGKYTGIQTSSIALALNAASPEKVASSGDSAASSTGSNGSNDSSSRSDTGGAQTSTPTPTSPSKTVASSTATPTPTTTVESSLMDLSIHSITPTSELKSGQNLSFYASIVNHVDGKGAMTPASKARARLDLNNDGSLDVDLGTTSSGQMRNDTLSQIKWTKVWVAVPGTHRIVVCADDDNVVAELNEENNCNSTGITISQVTGSTPSSPDTLPDLTAVGLQTLGDLKAGVMNGYNAKVANNNSGGVAAGESTTGAWLDIDNDGEFETNLNSDANNGRIPAIENYRVADVSWLSAGRAIAGIHRFRVCADIENKVEESREDNNCSEITFMVRK